MIDLSSSLANKNEGRKHSYPAALHVLVTAKKVLDLSAPLCQHQNGSANILGCKDDN